MAQVNPGDKLPQASLVRLTASGPGKVELAELAGNTALIIFFPLVNTDVCEAELCSVRDSMRRYNTLKARVVAISVDSPFAQKLWADKMGYNFEFWSDFNREAAKAFGCLHEELAGLRQVAKRSAFVVDKQGVIRYAWVSDDPGKLPDFTEIQDMLARL